MAQLASTVQPEVGSVVKMLQARLFGAGGGTKTGQDPVVQESVDETGPTTPRTQISVVVVGRVTVAEVADPGTVATRVPPTRT